MTIMSDLEWLRLVQKVLARFAEGESDQQLLAERLHKRPGYGLARVRKANGASDHETEALLIRELMDMGLPEPIGPKPLIQEDPPDGQ
jgi:hypothetical protein